MAKSPDKAAKAKLVMLDRFVSHYATHFNGAAAYRHAGFSCAEGSASELASRLLRRVEIQKAIDKAIGELGLLHYRLHEENTARLVAMRDADRTAILDADGNVLDPREWPEDCKHLLAGIEVEERMEGEGDAARMVRTKKVKLEPPRAIIDSLAKITGQWVDRSQFLDRNGQPVDPPNAVAPVINVTVGTPKGAK